MIAIILCIVVNHRLTQGYHPLTDDFLMHKNQKESDLSQRDGLLDILSRYFDDQNWVTHYRGYDGNCQTKPKK